MEKNYISIDRISMDKAQTDELIETLSFLQFQVLATLKNDTDGGLIKELSDTNEMIHNHMKVMSLLNQNAHHIQNTIDENKDKVDENVELLKEVAESIKHSLEFFNDFELNNKQRLENYLTNLNLRALTLSDELSKELVKTTTAIKEDIQKKFTYLNESINNSIVDDKDIKKLVELNTSISAGLKNLKSFTLQTKKLKNENLLLYSGISFLVGGITFSLLNWLFN
ncbi:hypothetical protein [Halarcobacter bivalviorum]|uniref:hypothetical protein n=1 Tax=Halarcobacter bivalviorum TaxID=663364 RepID=UPI00100BEF7C|nr:hypothetical protein [Halarcobacter bivalviorum]RXK05373.1 hypothetical protein CRU97_08505 [Halarcobacter bivalviorum]